MTAEDNKQGRPTRVLVSHLPYELVWELDDGADTVGMTDPRSLQIFVAHDLSAAQERDTVLHELLHACLKATGLVLSQRMEEQIAGALSPQLLMLFKNNRDLIPYLFGE